MSDFWLEAIAAGVYVTCFGATVHGWTNPKAYAVAPELSVVISVLYTRLIVVMLSDYRALIAAPLTTQNIYDLAWIPSLLCLTVLIPIFIFWTTMNLVRSYEWLPDGEDLAAPIWRANFFVVILSLATNEVGGLITLLIPDASAVAG